MSRVIDRAVALAVVLISAWNVRADKLEGITRPRFPTSCILRAVLGRMHLELRGDLDLPRVYFESTTPLSQFQRATVPQWGFTPEVFANAYVMSRNEIYLVDEANAYRAHGATIDDSLAHELTHYVQTRYLAATLDDDPSLEFQAVDVQRWFRETHVSGTPSHDLCEPLATASRP